MVSQDWIVMKFGGTSVSSAANWERITGLVRERLDEGWRVMIVHSAIAGISNLLLRLLDAAIERDYQWALDEIARRHEALAGELDLDFGSTAAPDLDELAELVSGISLTGEASASLQARVLAVGEIAATRIGEAFLRQQGLSVGWQDARSLLISRATSHRNERAQFLEARCEYGTDSALIERLADAEPCLITQGFIASNHRGATVLLGRGGSDTSAAYLAAKLAAGRLEVWTDVPGLFSANPKVVPAARLLRSVHYEEAQEIASSGGAVLHPRCITPVRKSGIPLRVGCTARPDLAGTLISGEHGIGKAGLKAIACRSPLTLLSVDSMDMWQQVGFLAHMFDRFREHGLSVDLVATSESNVTVSIDAATMAPADAALDMLEADLADLGRLKTIRNCAAISLIGRDVNRLLPEIGPALAEFDGYPVYLMSQASNGLNLTLVVESDAAQAIVARLHERLIDGRDGDGIFGPAWEVMDVGKGTGLSDALTPDRRP